ncbi:tonsoku-like protein isoform X1 [Diorhabda carinulata]|uniref:tonsoku-like protein isoform X1 n=1 Tax=Diorhabda carinulata TaxID=1163345 RepID=UPI0025A28848|nr:tonsoku-like protein isoform X1 [Diorhabda carinulata]
MDEIRLQKRKIKAQNEGNNRLLVAIYAELSELYMKSGQFERAVEEFKALAEIYKLEHNQIEYAKANRGIGEAYLGLNNYTKALEHQKIYLNIAIMEKNNPEIQRAYATIGHIYLTIHLETPTDSKENLNAAFKYFMKSMRVCESLTGISKVEKADMQARLFSNLGLVKDSQGDFNKAIELFTTSINVCKNNDIYEQMSRGYMSLAALYEKQNDSGKSMHHYNLAIEAAKKTKGNVDLMSGVLFAKSEALIKLGDFYGAKKSLYKAYKLNTPNIQERKLIEKYLRAVATMCKTEDKLAVESNDNRELKKLYEKMGDCACDVKNYSKALEYYKLMLIYAEKSGISGRELATCYNTLAQTYEDNKMYEEAVQHFEKEYNLRDNIKDCLDALSKIADNKESANRSANEVLLVYNRAIEHCQENCNLKEERRMITRCIQYLQRIHNETEACKYKQKLKGLKIPDNESDSSSSDNESDISISNTSKENYVELDDITDSDKSDSDLQTTINPTNIHIGKRRSKNFAVKKNAKGESQLHVACINGKIPVVKHLLEQGHPVNIRDNTGWLPIHEACNHGYYEIVELLLDKGAAINDRGGVKCEGITPIFDAANNGHLKIVELLLDRGASVTIKADNGDTTLNVLKLYHQKYPFTDDDYDLYQKLVKRISEALRKVGHNVEDKIIVHKTIEDSEEYNLPDDILSDKSDEENDSDHDSNSSSGDRFQRESSPNLLNEYQQVIKSLGTKSTSKKSVEIKSSMEKKSALIRERDLLYDDWLEDDLQPSKAIKKRKTTSTESIITSSAKRNNYSHVSPVKRSSDEIRSKPTKSPTAPSPSKRRFTIDNTQMSVKRKVQVSLLDTGVNKTSIGSRNKPNTTFQRHSSLEQSSKQSKITAFGNSKSFAEIESTVNVSPNVQSLSNVPVISTGDLMVYVDVKIEGKVFRVPVLLGQIQDNTIGWLADQAAQKYARKECSKPCLELETASGALLCDEDPLSLLFPLGTTQAEPVVGRIIKLYATPLVERYKEVCSHMREDVNDSLAKLLEEVSVKLNIQNRGFSTTLSPLCKALNHQTTLLDLNLSGNFLDVSCMAILCASLPSLVNLTSLNLRCTGLTSNHLNEIVKMFSMASGRILEKLKHLDLSNNYLRNKSFYHLSEITKHLKLEQLNIGNVEFTSGLFKEIENANSNLNLRDIRNLNMCYNKLSSSDIEKFLSWTTFGNIVELNLSGNCLNNIKVERWNDTFNENNLFISLECLNLSRSKLQDNDLYELLRLCSGKSLVNINLSYNTDLTGISLRRLIENPTLEEINLIGCNRIFEYFPESLDTEEAIGKRNIKLTADFDNEEKQVEKLIQYFEKIYIQPIVEKGRNLLSIYSKSKEL